MTTTGASAAVHRWELRYKAGTSDKFYKMNVLGLKDMWKLTRTWGRTGSAGQEKTEYFTTQTQAVAAAQHIETEKLAKGYKRVAYEKLEGDPKSVTPSVSVAPAKHLRKPGTGMTYCGHFAGGVNIVGPVGDATCFSCKATATQITAKAEGKMPQAWADVSEKPLQAPPVMWKKKDGTQIRVVDMQTEHLVNALKMMQGAAEKIREQRGGTVEEQGYRFYGARWNAVRDELALRRSMGVDDAPFIKVSEVDIEPHMPVGDAPAKPKRKLQW